MNKHTNLATPSGPATGQQNTAVSHIVLTFDENKYASMLFGKYDENLAFIEQALHITAVTRGNEVDLRGEKTAVERAKLVLEELYEKICAGENVGLGDFDGAVRMSNTPKREATNKSTSAPSGAARITTNKKTVQARSPVQDDYIRALASSELVFGVGPAGTGKTYLAVAHSAFLIEQGAIDRIILTRPAVEAGERLGFLPGDMKEKVDPYLRPLYDALYDMMPGDKVERALESGAIEIAPLAFMRGRTLANSAIILDEAQNTTSMQMKMFLTRLGENSCMIITGDPSQIDLPAGQVSGLVESMAILKTVKSIKQIKFTSADVVRHHLVAKIVEAYERASPQPTAPQK